MAELLPDSPLTLRIKTSGVVQGMPWNNLFYAVYVSGTPTNADCGVLAAQLSSDWNTTLGLCFGQNAQLRQVTVWDLSSRNGATGFDATVHSGQHTGTTTVPPSVAACVSWSVQQRWRGGHPRTYIPISYAADCSSTLIAGTHQTLLLSSARAWRTAINGRQFLGAALTMYTIRYFHDRGQMYPIPAKLPIQDAAVHSRLDSMRRRLGKEVYT